MSAPKCTECGASSRKVRHASKMFLNRYIVSDVALHVCPKCGAEFLDGKEYERIRRKIASIESARKVPAVAQVMAKARFLVL